jgi:hypothetical protein
MRLLLESSPVGAGLNPHRQSQNQKGLSKFPVAVHQAGWSLSPKIESKPMQHPAEPLSLFEAERMPMIKSPDHFPQLSTLNQFDLSGMFRAKGWRVM